MRREKTGERKIRGLCGVPISPHWELWQYESGDRERNRGATEEGVRENVEGDGFSRVIPYKNPYHSISYIYPI